MHRIARVLHEDPVIDVRVAAAAALGRLGTRAALDPLLAELSPEVPAVLRSAAAMALGDLGTPSAVPYLATLLDDDEFWVAHEAARSLRRLGPPGLAALRATLEAERAAGRAGGPSPAAAHCREALALADVTRPAPAPAQVDAA